LKVLYEVFCSLRRIERDMIKLYIVSYTTVLRLSVRVVFHYKVCNCIYLVFLNRRAAARYRALASIIPGRERFSWNLSFFMNKCFIVEIF